MTTVVLVLNQDWSVLAAARVPRALALIARSKAEVLALGVLPIETPTCSIPRPSVIRLFHYVRRPRPHIRFGRQNIFKRDDYTCQYCGVVRPRELTLDHVLPASRGGQDTWENLVASCRPCNKRKGARTPQEARMTLRKQPVEPRVSSFLHLVGVGEQPEWMPFIHAV